MISFNPSRFALMYSLACALSAPAWADGRLMPALVPTVYKQECSACHMAYPPAMLSKPSWQRIMGGLEKNGDSRAEIACFTKVLFFGKIALKKYILVN